MRQNKKIRNKHLLRIFLFCNKFVLNCIYNKTVNGTAKN